VYANEQLEKFREARAAAHRRVTVGRRGHLKRPARQDIDDAAAGRE